MPLEAGVPYVTDNTGSRPEPLLQYVDRTLGRSLVVLFQTAITPAAERGGPSIARAEGLGSGILLRIGNRVFILTADHVIRSVENCLDTVRVGMGFFTSEYRPLAPLNALSIIRSPRECAAALDEVGNGHLPDGAECLTLNDVKLDLTGETRFCFLGLPALAVTGNAAQPVRSEPIPLNAKPFICLHNKFTGNTSEIGHGLGDGVPYHERYHFVLNDREEGAPPSRRPSSLRGVSGSGTFVFDVFSDRIRDCPIKGTFKLIGIEHQVGMGHYIMGTKIGFLLNLIYDRFPELEDPLGFYRPNARGLFDLNPTWNP